MSHSPSVAVHLHQTDTEMEDQGFGTADIVCHLCAVAWTVSYPDYDPKEAEKAPLAGILDSFAANHHHDAAPFCCEPKTVERYLDFREVARA